MNVTEGARANSREGRDGGDETIDEKLLLEGTILPPVQFSTQPMVLSCVLDSG